MSFVTTFVEKIAQRTAALSKEHMDHAVTNAALIYKQNLENSMILQGRALALINENRAPLTKLQDAEFKVFSQFGEDGILQYLIYETKIDHNESVFIEFGVQDYSESNTRFLLMNNNWRGMIIDGSTANMDSVRSQSICWRHDLTVKDAWIDRDNINQFITEAGFQGNIGMLSIDVDGNDYWVWEQIHVVNPIIVVVEWNSVFGSTHAISVPYDPMFQREKAHYSHLFFGASIAAFEHLGKSKGYSLIGSNTAGNNLFFVRNDRLGNLKALSSAEAYIESRFRDSRDAMGQLNYLSGSLRRAEIQDLSVVDVVKHTLTTMRMLDSSSEVGLVYNSLG